MTVKAHLAGLRVAEVPTTWRDRTAGESRFRLRKWLPYYLRWYRRAMLARLRPSRRAGL
jgi:dolichol-phosphate mannosyltransferase